ncbi:SCAN domain-containing protein, partial [Ooceraea biroi]
IHIKLKNLQFQEELCKLQTDISLKSRTEKGIEFFKILEKSSYLKLINFSLRIFSMFSSTYLCECSFSKMKYIKTDKRSALNDKSLSSLMQTNISNINVDIPTLVDSHKRFRRSDP